MSKSKRTKACDISPIVKQIVWERDHHRCIFCGTHRAMPNAHYIPRSKGGLGIEENIVTACIECHGKFDFGTKDVREKMKQHARSHLNAHYPNFPDEKRIYHK